MPNFKLIFGALLLSGVAFATPPSHSNAGGLPACEDELAATDAELADAEAALEAAQSDIDALTLERDQAALLNEYQLLLRLQEHPELLSAEGVRRVDSAVKETSALLGGLGGGAQVFTGNGPIFLRGNPEG